jgi:diguanylate cyclase (GGDEF)-like protein/putative nucleotidyltransferase with HDIG domain
MSQLNMERERRQIKKTAAAMVGFALVTIAGAAIGVALIESSSVSAGWLALLAIALVIVLLISSHEFKIPYTEQTILPKDLLTFWGIMWLGVAGGLLVTAFASAAARKSTLIGRRSSVVLVAIDVISGLLAGLTFYGSLDYLNGHGPLFAAALVPIPNSVLIAACAMAVVHCLSRESLATTFDALEGLAGSLRGVAFSFLASVTSTSVNLIATVILFVVFDHFGIEIGLLILPIVVVGKIAYSIHLNRLAAKTRELTEANRMHLATVEALATAIDARDQVGVGHVRRTQIYALGLGKLLGMTEEEIDALRTGALLHDIGKLAVPDHILNKPGRLTQAEMAKSRVHAMVGASILDSVGFPYPVIPTVKYHHERWDGSGYPEGLKGIQIPRTARILAIADVFDSLRAARPYRAALSRDEAILTLEKGSGSQFDPYIVDVFVRNLDIFDREIKANGLDYESNSELGNMSQDRQHAGSKGDYVNQIKRAHREVFTLYSLAKDFGSLSGMDDILSVFTAKIRDFVPYDTSVIYLMDESRTSAVAKFADGKNKEALLSNRIPVGEGATGYVLETSKPVSNVDPALDLAFSHGRLTSEYTAMVSLPLIGDEGLVGAVSLYSSQLSCYTDEHIRLLESVSRMASDAIRRSLQMAETKMIALTDPLTGLPNSRALQAQFDKEAKRAARSDASFQMLVLDLDGFKAVNDTHGHTVGDAMLRGLAQLIQSQLREYDFLARYGGDEFVAIIPDTDTADVLDLSRRIERAVRDFTIESDTGETVGGVGISIGAANFPLNGETFDQIVVAADKAMYLTKAIHKQSGPLPTTSDNGQRRRPWADDIVEDDNVPYEFVSPEIVTVYNEDNEFEEVDIDEGLVIEIDETHVVTSEAIN